MLISGLKYGIKDTRSKPDFSRFHCSLCPYSSPLSANLKRHLMTHTGERPFACSVCNYRCSQKGHLKRHLEVHMKQNKF